MPLSAAVPGSTQCASVFRADRPTTDGADLETLNDQSETFLSAIIIRATFVVATCKVVGLPCFAGSWVAVSKC